MRFGTRVYIDNTEPPEFLWVDKGDGSMPLAVDLHLHSVTTESAYSGDELAAASKIPARGLVELRPPQEV